MATNFTEDVQDFNPLPVKEDNQVQNNEDLKKIIIKLKDRIRDLEARITAGGL